MLLTIPEEDLEDSAVANSKSIQRLQNSNLGKASSIPSGSFPGSQITASLPLRTTSGPPPIHQRNLEIQDQQLRPENSDKTNGDKADSTELGNDVNIPSQ